ASVAALAEGVLKAMLWTKLKAATVVLLLLALVAVSYGFLTPGQAGTVGDESKGRPAPGEKPPAPGKAGRPKELDALTGSRAGVTVERNGQQAPAEALKGFKVTIKGNRMTIGDRTSTFTLDPSKRPKWLDNTPEQGPNKGQSLPAIYELQGDTLKLCFDNEGV